MRLSMQPYLNLQHAKKPAGLAAGDWHGTRRTPVSHDSDMSSAREIAKWIKRPF